MGSAAGRSGGTEVVLTLPGAGLPRRGTRPRAVDERRGRPGRSRTGLVADVGAVVGVPGGRSAVLGQAVRTRVRA